MKFVIPIEIDLPEIDPDKVAPAFLAERQRDATHAIVVGIVTNVNDQRRGPIAPCVLNGQPLPEGVESRKKAWGKEREALCPACKDDRGRPTDIRITARGNVYKHDGYQWPGGPAIEFRDTEFGKAWHEAQQASWRSAQCTT